jgi:hypothetical protein
VLRKEHAIGGLMGSAKSAPSPQLSPRISYKNQNLTEHSRNRAEDNLERERKTAIEDELSVESDFSPRIALATRKAFGGRDSIKNHPEQRL